jgi:hypothetical protein
MPNTNWQISGDCFGNCSCDYLRCPCPSSNFTEQPSRGWCNLVLILYVDRGHYGNVALDGLTIAIVAHCPGIMAEGNWSLGLIVDERATPEQQQALAAIFSGQAGGPIAAFSPWVGQFLGLEARPIQFQKNGRRYSVSIPGRVDLLTEGTAGANPNEPVYLDNLPHPVNSRVALARGVQSHLHAFGIDWDGIEGRNFAIFCSFNWQVS